MYISEGGLPTLRKLGSCLVLSWNIGSFGSGLSLRAVQDFSLVRFPALSGEVFSCNLVCKTCAAALLCYPLPSPKKSKKKWPYLLLNSWKNIKGLLPICLANTD